MNEKAVGFETDKNVCPTSSVDPFRVREKDEVGQTFLSARIREWGHSCPPSGFESIREGQECPPTHRFETDRNVCPTKWFFPLTLSRPASGTAKQTRR
jgi:hypothetical protein